MCLRRGNFWETNVQRKTIVRLSPAMQDDGKQLPNDVFASDVEAFEYVRVQASLGNEECFAALKEVGMDIGMLQ